MIESPLLKELMAENTREAILEVLAGRFGREARTLRSALRKVEDNKPLKKLLNQCGRCPDLESFKKLLEP